MYVDDWTSAYSVRWAQNLVRHLTKSPYVSTVVVRLATHYLWSEECGANWLQSLNDLLLFLQGHRQVKMTERSDSEKLRPLLEADFDRAHADLPVDDALLLELSQDRSNVGDYAASKCRDL